MSFEQLNHLLYNARRIDILYENDSIQTYTLLKCWKELVAQRSFIKFTIESKIRGMRTCHLLEKIDPTMYDAINPYQTVTFAE